MARRASKNKVVLAISGSSINVSNKSKYTLQIENTGHPNALRLKLNFYSVLEYLC